MKPEYWRILKDGFLARAVLYITVAVFFAVVNVLVGRSPLYTAHVLGEALLGVLVAEVSHVLPWHSVATGHLAGAAATTGFLWGLHAMRPDAEPEAPGG